LAESAFTRVFRRAMARNPPAGYGFDLAVMAVTILPADPCDDLDEVAENWRAS
jgi:hypothetical protein